MVHPFPTLPRASYLQSKGAPGVLRLFHHLSTCCALHLDVPPHPSCHTMLLPPLGLLSWLPAFTPVCLSCLLCGSWDTCCPPLLLPAPGCPCGLVPGHPSPLQWPLQLTQGEVCSQTQPRPSPEEEPHKSRSWRYTHRGNLLSCDREFREV